jgi:hypothetical protein
MRVFVAIPAYDGKVCVETVDALLGESLLAFSQGHVLDVRFLPGCSAIHSARNAMVQDFLDSGCDRMVFIDADVKWTPGDLLKLAQMPHDLIGGAYRHKRAEEAYVVQWDDDVPELHADKHGALKVKGLGCGFLAVSRYCLEAIRGLGDRTYSEAGKTRFAYFDMPFDGVLWGEDLRFCHMARLAGVSCHVLPELELTHVGGPFSHFTGRLGDWLRGRLNGSDEL